MQPRTMREISRPDEPSRMVSMPRILAAVRWESAGEAELEVDPQALPRADDGHRDARLAPLQLQPGDRLVHDPLEPTRHLADGSDDAPVGEEPHRHRRVRPLLLGRPSRDRGLQPLGALRRRDRVLMGIAAREPDDDVAVRGRQVEPVVVEGAIALVGLREGGVAGAAAEDHPVIVPQGPWRGKRRRTQPPLAVLLRDSDGERGRAAGMNGGVRPLSTACSAGPPASPRRSRTSSVPSPGTAGTPTGADSSPPTPPSIPPPFSPPPSTSSPVLVSAARPASTRAPGSTARRSSGRTPRSGRPSTSARPRSSARGRTSAATAGSAPARRSAPAPGSRRTSRSARTPCSPARRSSAPRPEPRRALDGTPLPDRERRSVVSGPPLSGRAGPRPAAASSR